MVSVGYLARVRGICLEFWVRRVRKYMKGRKSRLNPVRLG